MGDFGFFKASVTNSFVEGGLEYAQFGADARYGNSDIQHRLGFYETLIGKFGALAAGILDEKTGHSLVAKFSTHALDGD